MTTYHPAPCPNCGAVSYVEDEECWRCQLQLVPGCPDCRRPIALGGGICSHCGSTIKQYALVPPWTTTK